MVLELVKGVVLLLALSLLHSLSIRALRGQERLSQISSGVLFGGICVIGMMTPLVMTPGVIFDARSVVISMASLFGGPLTGTIAALIAGGYRWYLGGVGANVGTAVVFISYAMGLAYYYAHRASWVNLGWPTLLGFGLLVHLLEVSLFFQLPPDVAPKAIATVGIPLLLVFTPASLLMGLVLKDVRSRFETEIALDTHQARLQATVHAIPDLLFLLDEDGKFVEVLSSRSNLRVTSGDSLLGRRLHDVLPVVEANRLLDQVLKTLELQATQMFEYEIKTQRGMRRFEGRTHPLAERLDKRRAVVLLARDVTERSAAQDELRASEARFRNLLQNLPSVAVQGYTPDGTITYWNHASERLYGYTTAEAVGRNLFETIVPNALRKPMRDALQDMASSGEVIVPAELVLVHKNGKDVPVFSSHAAVHNPAEQAEFFRFDIDLADRKRTEEELRVAATAFEAQEGMLVTNAKREILRVNQAFTRISGYEDHEVIGKTPSLFSSGWHDNAFYAEMNDKLARDGTWQGELWNRRKNGEVYPQWMHITAVTDESKQLTHYVATVTDITQRKAAEDQIRQLAFYDPLTGLPNRRMLMDRLQHALAGSARSGACGALLFIDLDHFKTLNDTLGHDKGDLLLQQVAQRLMEAVREEDTVARLGGDEYVVMLEGLDAMREVAAAQATAVGEKLIAALNAPFGLAGHEYHSTPSIGLTLYSGHEVGIDELLKQADLAMYQAKNAGRNGLRFFDPLMQAAVSQRAELEADIRQGILYGQFLLYYQPQVNAQGRVFGAEALLRWLHPVRGLVSPGSFIPVAEESGQILTLGSWALETACAQLVEWAKAPHTEPLVLAVNVSSRQFRQQDFADHILAMLDYTGANPRRLKLELTESLLVDNVDDVIAKMTSLRARGVGFSLDDFGTGYSSLSYLKRLPLDQLKIDQSFVQDVLTDPNDAAIARTIVALGNSLGLAVIAEGVETAAQRDFLAQNGCSAYQGYYFSRPLPVDVFEAYLSAQA
ncbi:EAL domain-containing protein [Rhodoferax saidenbachensis]|uniref:Diguanylate cyclase (GGDEF)-like protein/PAS domain S-box-containing protein n=1 Tax=Rhodoferax saidenbachensis TaxID=1484693 RepID=A0ABU1ZIF0_9BURK|nr:EAL domain-containing protein [Rhodoferax saidenbachensis]MDR7305309.1 diguanylate cyclase (GGDEF)-like protein/PAS domain S-box-containing protein [Rhodoferax saidenbachensis]